MKLTELDPTWVTTGNGRHGMGVMFECPHCRERYVGCWFANSIDGGPPYSEVRHDGTPEPLWQRTGDTFETLTLEPSIDVSKDGHWHGYVRNGQIA